MKVEALAKQKVKAQLDDLCKKLQPPATQQQVIPQRAPSKNKGVSYLFSKSISHFARGLVRVAKDDLMQTFDFGVPPNADAEGLDAIIGPRNPVLGLFAATTRRPRNRRPIRYARKRKKRQREDVTTSLLAIGRPVGRHATTDKGL